MTVWTARPDCTPVELSQTLMNCLRVLAALYSDKILFRFGGEDFLWRGGYESAPQLLRHGSRWQSNISARLPVWHLTLLYPCIVVGMQWCCDSGVVTVMSDCYLFESTGVPVPLLPFRSLCYLFTPHCLSALNCIYGYLAIDIG